MNVIVSKIDEEKKIVLGFNDNREILESSGSHPLDHQQVPGYISSMLSKLTGERKKATRNGSERRNQKMQLDDLDANVPKMRPSTKKPIRVKKKGCKVSIVYKIGKEGKLERNKIVNS